MRERGKSTLARLAGHPSTRADACGQLVVGALLHDRPLALDEPLVARTAASWLREVALHEAAHVAALRLVGRRIREVKIGQPNSFTDPGHPSHHRCLAGIVCPANPADVHQHLRRHPACRADLVGRVEEDAFADIFPAAVELEYLTRDRRTALGAITFENPDGADDVALALKMLGGVERNELRRWRRLHALVLRARQLARTTRVRRAIKIVVEELLEHPHLRGQRLEALLARVDAVLAKSKEDRS